MCGIAGIVSAEAPISKRRLKAAMDELAHRGPDGEGMFVRDCSKLPFIALGHRRLAVIDVSQSAAQPMHSDPPGCCISYNGEIYNYVELRRELVALGMQS